MLDTTLVNSMESISLSLITELFWQWKIVCSGGSFAVAQSQVGWS